MRPAWVTALVMLPGHRGQGPCSALHTGHLSLGPCSVLGLDIKWKVLTVTEPALTKCWTHVPLCHPVTPGGKQSYVHVTVEETEGGKRKVAEPGGELRPL